MLTKEKKMVQKKEHHPAMPRYHTKENKNCMYYTINRNLGKILSLFTCSEVLSAPFHLPAFTTSPLSHGCPTAPPPPPPNYNFHSHYPSPPSLIYHCQSNSITHPPLNYNATATPPSLLVTNNNITLSPSLIYQLSLHVGITDPCQYNSCNCHYNIADITLLPPPQCISNLIT